MNCLEFRRNKLADPQTASADVIAHARTCSVCAEFAQQLEMMEQRLRTTVNTQVPPNLADRVLLTHRLKQGQPRRGMFAIAATLFMGVCAALLYSLLLRENVANASIAHVLEEPTALEEAQTVPVQDIMAAFAQSGARLTGTLGAVTHLTRCKVPGGYGEHFVVQTSLGKVTLILMPDHSLAARVIGHEAGLNAVVVPAGRGSYAVVTDSMQKTLEVEGLINQNVRWPA